MGADSSDTSRFASLLARALSLAVYWYLVAVEVVLALGFTLQLLGANPSSEFVRWVYRSTERAMGPFRGMFDQLVLSDRATVPAVLDTSIFFAMLIYGIVAMAIHGVIDWLDRRIRRADAEDRRAALRDAYAANWRAVQPADLPDAVGDADRSAR